jgi:hypothetical protein
VALLAAATAGVLEGTSGADVTHHGVSTTADGASPAAHFGQAAISPLGLKWFAGNGVWQWGQAVALCMGMRLVERM